MAASRVNRFKEEFASEDVAPEDFLDSTGTSQSRKDGLGSASRFSHFSAPY